MGRLNLSRFVQVSCHTRRLGLCESPLVSFVEGVEADILDQISARITAEEDFNTSMLTDEQLWATTFPRMDRIQRLDAKSFILADGVLQTPGHETIK